MIPVAVLNAAGSAWGFLKGLPWKWIGLGLAALLVVREIERFGYHERDGEVSNLKDQIGQLRAASKQADIQNRQEVKTQEAAQADTTKDANHDDQIRKAAADDAVEQYIRLHSYTRGGSCGALGLPACPDPARAVAQADANAEIHDPIVIEADDARICKEAVLKGQSFDSWWPKAEKIINDAADASERAADMER